MIQTQIDIDPAFSFSPLRVQTAREFRYFHVSTETTYARMGDAFMALLTQVCAARDAAHANTTGPVVVIYRYHDAARDRCTLEVGFAVDAETQASHGAQVRDVTAFRCAALIYWGDIPHIEQAGYHELERAIAAAGLCCSPEYRECHFNFESDASANNVILIQRGIQE
jgi:hypothetical protein